MKHCRVPNTRQSDKIPLVTIIHYQDATASALGHTLVATYYPELNPRRRFPLNW